MKSTCSTRSCFPALAALRCLTLGLALGLAPGGCTAGGGGNGTDGGGNGTDGGNGDGGTLTCAAAQQLCALPFSWTFTGGAIQPDVVEVRGTFNNWSPGANPMTLSAGVWTATVPLPVGVAVEYKFFAQWNNNPNAPLWVTDPHNPVTAADGNSELQSVSCARPACQPARPALQLVGQPTTSASSYSFQVKFIPAGAALDPTKTVITLNGTPLAAGAVPYDSGTRTFSVSVSSGVTAPNKYGYLFQVQDQSGQAASLFVPFWIEASPFQWQDALMYEVMIDRFLAGGTSQAGPNGPPTAGKGDWMGGDFGGVTKKLSEGYFDGMGVNTLWISSPVKGTSLCELGAAGSANAPYCLSGYHSYFPIASGWVSGSQNDPLFTGNGITSPIEPHFGTDADLKTLVQTAHARGIRVVVDLVVNHVFSDANPPMGQKPQLAPLWIAHQNSTAWFNLPYNLNVNDCGNENLWDTSTDSLWNRTNCWFDPYLPDFNSDDDTVNDTVADHAVWLMEEFNLDGFRVDATKQVAHYECVALRSKLSAAIATGLPFYMVGEALGSVVGNVMDCVGADRLNGSVNDPLHNTIVNTFLQGSENGNSLDGDLQYDESTWSGVYPDALMGHFFGSHDVPRAISLAAGNVGDAWDHPPPTQETNPVAFQRLKLAQAFLLTYDSLPILWMGDEFGQPGSFDPDNRRMMRFGNALSGNEISTMANFATLGRLRAAHPALRRGSRTRLWVDGTFYAYGRVYDNGSDIVVAAFNLDPNNSATRAIQVNNIGLTGTVTDALSKNTATVSNNILNITLPPLTAAVFTH